MCHFRQELGTCLAWKPASIAAIFENSLRESRVVLWLARIQLASRLTGFNKRGHRRPDIFGIKINGHRLTLLNLIGAIRHAD